MKLSKTTYTLILLTISFFTSTLYGQKNLNLTNSNLEIVTPEGNFFKWKSQAVKGGQATFSVETSDVNEGSKRALKANVFVLGENGWLVSTQFDKTFKGDVGEEVTISFYAKKGKNGDGKLKLVLQSDVKGSYSGKDFFLTEHYQKYTHKFIIKENSDQNQIKFWYLSVGTTYYLDDLSISK